jgi:hypothetical protein
LGLVTCSGLFFRIDPGKVKIVTFAMLFNRKTAAQAFDAWLAAENGDPSGLAVLFVERTIRRRRFGVKQGVMG